MGNKDEVYTAYRLAVKIGQPPNDLLGFDLDGWLAYTFNRAVVVYGNWVDNQLEERDKNGKPRHRLDEILEAGTINGYEHRERRVSTASLRALLGNQVEIR